MSTFKISALKVETLGPSETFLPRYSGFRSLLIEANFYQPLYVMPPEQ
jgi:hypothetical protein